MTDNTVPTGNITVLKEFFSTDAKPVSRKELSDLTKEERAELADLARVEAV